MDTAMAIAVSGMAAASASLSVSASNIANMETIGPVPPTSPSQPLASAAGGIYQPVSAASTALPDGGVQTVTLSKIPGYALAYDPSAPFANLQGMVATPNVDPVAEVVNQISASAAFQANLNVFKAADKDLKTLLDTLA